MEELKEKIKQMNKKQKEICIMAVIVIIFIIGRIVYMQNTRTSSSNSSSSTSKTSSESISSKSSSSTSTSNSDKVTTSSKAISYAKTYAEYGLSSKIKSSSGLHSIRRFEITDANARESGSYYEVTLKGNGSGYSDSYDTKFKTLTFDAKVEVSKKTGNVNIISVSARTK